MDIVKREQIIDDLAVERILDKSVTLAVKDCQQGDPDALEYLLLVGWPWLRYRGISADAIRAQVGPLFYEYLVRCGDGK